MHDHTSDPWPCKRCGAIIDRAGKAGQAKSWCRDCSQEYMRQYMLDHPEKYFKPCPLCGGQCGVQAKSCRSCQHPRPVARPCLECGVSFEPLRGSPTCCSTSCRNLHNTRTRYRNKADRLNGTCAECAWCFASFDFSSHRPCCSAVCSSARDRHWSTWKHPLTCHLPQCMDCASVFALTTNGKRCNKCQLKFDADRRSFSEARRKRAERNGDMDIHWRRLGDRDSWCCHLCGGRVPKVAGTAKNERGATVDHLVPISCGGAHSWDNVAIAHRSCNLSRGVGGAVQLLLVG